MRKVPKGKLVTINQIRELLAARPHASTACPITTGIFAGVAARAADQDEQEGKKRITPYWRTLKEGGEVNPKHPGGLERAAAALAPYCRNGERLAVSGDAVWIDYAGGVARSRLTSAVLDRCVGSTVTLRNWKSVQAIDALVAER